MFAAAIGGIREGVTVGEFGLVFLGMAEAWDAPFGLLLWWVGRRHGRIL